mgnify:CR=1 FL=1
MTAMTPNSPTGNAAAHEVETFIRQTFVHDPRTTLTPDTPLLDSGVIDSTGVLEVVAFIEKTFNIHVADEDLVPANLDSISRIAAFVARKQKG